MIIINADDWGRSRTETDATLICWLERRVSSVSAMMFMEDSERAADAAAEHGIDVGLHLNLSQPYNGCVPSTGSREAQDRIVRFMTLSKYAVLLYHPWLRQSFRDVYQAQTDEFLRLYGKVPSHVDGHQHRHLCANVLLDGIIPRGQKVRRNLSFLPGEKSLVNRAYRLTLDTWLAHRYRMADYLFNLSQCLDRTRLERVMMLACHSMVELETHPCKEAERVLLMSDEFGDMLKQVKVAPYALL